MIVPLSRAVPDHWQFSLRNGREIASERTVSFRLSRQGLAFNTGNTGR